MRVGMPTFARKEAEVYLAFAWLLSTTTRTSTPRLCASSKALRDGLGCERIGSNANRLLPLADGFHYQISRPHIRGEYNLDGGLAFDTPAWPTSLL